MTHGIRIPAIAAAVAAALSVFSALAALAETVPFRPDEAILACQARAMHMIEIESGADAKALGRFATERRADHLWHVSGAFSALFDGRAQQVGIDCDVSSAGVEVMVMRIGG